MIKDSIKSGASKIFKGIKSARKTAGTYALNELAGEVEHRSPRTAGVAKAIGKKITDIRELNKLAAANYKQFVEADASGAEEFKEEVQKNNPGLTSVKAVEKATLSVIRRIEDSIKKDPVAAKESDLYKKYEKNFEAYAAVLKEQTAKYLKPMPEEQKAPPTFKDTGHRDLFKQRDERLAAAKDNQPTILEDIAENTKETAETLKKNEGTKPTTETAPKTISTVINNAGADLVSKIFTEKTIERYAGKIRESLGIREDPVSGEAISVEPSEVKTKDPVVDELKKVNKFLEDRAEKAQTEKNQEQENKIEAKKSELDQVQENLKEKLKQEENKTVENAKKVEDRLNEKGLEKSNPIKRDTDADVDIPDNDTRTRRERKRSDRQNKKIRGRNLNQAGEKLVQAGQEKNYVPDLNKPKLPGTQKISGGRFTEPAYRAGQLVGKAGRSIATGARTIGSATMNTASSIGRAASLASSAPGMAAGGAAMGTLGTAALWGGGALLAGAAGYGIGTLAAKGIDSGTSALSGKETSLGGWIYDQFNGDEDPMAKMDRMEAEAKLNKAIPNKAVAGQVNPAVNMAAANVAPQITAKPAQQATLATVEPAKTGMVDIVETALNKQDTIAADKEEKMSQPIIVNNGGNTTNNSSGGGGGGGAIVASPVRNTESTFERVQMQDFWPRAK